MDVRPDQLRPWECDEEVKTDVLAHALHERNDAGPSGAREIARRVACLLATGADPNGNCKLVGGDTVSMLFVATKCQKRDAKLVFLLLAAGADPYAPTSRHGWSLAEALTSRELDASIHEGVLRFCQADCDTLLEVYRNEEECPDNEIDVSDIASFFRNLRKEDLLHAAAALCDFEGICQLLYCRSPEFDPNREIKLNGALVCPLSLAYYSCDPDSDLCVYAMLIRADPHMPSMEMKLPAGEGFWTLAGAARMDEQADMLETIKQIQLRNRIIVHPEVAADWIWSRISCVGVTTAVVESMVDYLLPCMYLHELVREVLAASPEDEETVAEHYWQLAEQLLCASARVNDDKTVELLLGKGTNVDSHDASKRSAAPTHCQSLYGSISHAA